MLCWKFLTQDRFYLRNKVWLVFQGISTWPVLSWLWCVCVCTPSSQTSAGPQQMLRHLSPWPGGWAWVEDVHSKSKRGMHWSTAWEPAAISTSVKEMERKLQAASSRYNSLNLGNPSSWNIFLCRNRANDSCAFSWDSWAVEKKTHILSWELKLGIVAVPLSGTPKSPTSGFCNWPWWDPTSATQRGAPMRGCKRSREQHWLSGVSTMSCHTQRRDLPLKKHWNI